MADFGPPDPLTGDDLIAILERTLEPHWIEGILADPTSRSLFEAAAAAMLRVQDAVDEVLGRGVYLLSSPGRAPATCTVRLFRAGGGTQVVVDSGIRFLDERGMEWVPSDAYTIPASGIDQTVDVPVRSVRTGYWLNTIDPPTFEAVDALPDPSLVILPGADAATGGVTSFLDQHGKERRVHRAPGESDATYRARIRFLEDAVSPAAVAATLYQVLDAYPATRSAAEAIVLHGLRALLEPFTDSAQLSLTGLRGMPGAYLDDVQPVPVAAVTQDPGGTFLDDALGHYLRELRDATAWVDVRIPTPVDPDEARQFWDDGDADFGFFLDDPLLAFLDLPTGDAILSAIAALADELARRLAGGVGARILVGEDLFLSRSPAQGTLVQAGDWVDQDGSALDGDLTTAVQVYDAEDSYAASATGTGAGGPSDPGDLLYELPQVPAPASISHVIVRARVRRADQGAGVDPVLSFVVRPSGGNAVRVGGAVVDHNEWREVVLTLDENPDTAAPWALADVAATFRVGVANTAAVGATEELRVSELVLELVLGYG